MLRLCIDGDLLVNIFTPEQRERYNLEKLWANGEELDVSDCILGPENKQVEKVESEESLDNWVD